MVKYYNHDEHYDNLCQWLADKNLTKPDPKCLSTIGFVVNNCAIGFLYLTNSDICYIDCFAADPKATKEDRSIALDILVEELEKIAKEEGCRMVHVFSSLTPIQTRASKLGYQSNGTYIVFTKEL